MATALIHEHSPLGGRARIRRLAIGLICLLSLPVAAAAQTPGVESDLPADGYVARNTSFQLHIDPASHPEDARLAFFIDATDVTALFRPAGGGAFRYAGELMPLPSGEHELVVFSVDGEAWTELDRLPLRVLTAGGFERVSADPSLSLSLDRPLGRGLTPAPDGPGAPLEQTFSGQLTFNGDFLRSGTTFGVSATVIGTSEQEQALRYGLKGDDAPRVDLSDYTLRSARGPFDLSVGHVQFGRHRHLAEGFGGRGAQLSLAAGRLDAAFTVSSGSQVVGWSDLFGFERPDHRMASASLGLEVLDRPGGLRLELSALDGSVLPLTDFNQGAIVDAEESRGMAVRAVASDASGRLRLDGGLSRSTLRVPADPALEAWGGSHSLFLYAQVQPMLEPGYEFVPVEETTADARYLEADVDLLRDIPLGASRTFALSIGYRHERVDPLYRSLAAYAAADQASHHVQLTGDVAGLVLNASHTRLQDNLDEIASILKTLTRRTGAGVTAPLAQIFQVGEGAEWLPMVQLTLDRTHQFGRALPENGGFDPSHIPDQVSDTRSAALNWQWQRLGFGYRLDLSRQDNRQPGRENADFKTRVHAFSTQLMPTPTLMLDLGLDFDRAESEEEGQVDLRRRFGVGANWAAFARTSIALNASRADDRDEADTRRREALQFSGQLSSALPWLGEHGGTFFLRYSRSLERFEDREFDLDESFAMWSWDSGLSFTFF